MSNTLHRIGFLLEPNFSTIAFASAIEPLRMANYLSGKRLYDAFTISLDGGPVPASNGVRIMPDYGMDTVPPMDILFVCGPTPVPLTENKTLANWLRKLARQGTILGGVCTGAELLARAGLLNGYRCTIHWENMESLRESFPGIIVSSNLFELDRDRYTCTGGIGPLDMMLQLIARQQGPRLAAAISEQFMLERIRDARDRQRVPLRLQLGGGQPRLADAVALMESNIEEPISLEEVARHVGISKRQLERLFKDHLDCTPARYYMELRLQRARLLLRQTRMSITDVALSCGFVSVPHFTTRYHRLFGVSPRSERRAGRERDVAV
ncbi:MAG TPA: GlxA family transcriptional regulator [Candidatus Competibacteraceae bacterium]|nr:GlxA family transcriptional regulator [Candidatus Competibacteraceae bacterium]